MTFCNISYSKFKNETIDEYKKSQLDNERLKSLINEYNIEQLIVGFTSDNFRISLSLWELESDFKHFQGSDYRKNVHGNYVELRGDSYRFSVIINETVEQKDINQGICRIVRYHVKKGLVSEYIQEYNKLSNSHYLEKIGASQTMLLSDRGDMTSMADVTIWKSKKAMFNYKSNPKRKYLIDNYLEDFRILGIFELERLLFKY